MVIHIVNGPNLNLLGVREPEIYGHVRFEDYLLTLKDFFSDVDIEYFQSNHEGALLDYIQKFGLSADHKFVFNPAAYTHTSIALADCVAALISPVIEVHISDTEKREDFRKISFIRPHVVKTIQGHGLDGYKEAIAYFLEN